MQESVDNSGMFQSILSSAYPAPRLSYPTNKRPGEHKNLGGSTATTADLRSIPDYMASSSVYKAAEKEKGGTFREMVFAFSTRITCDGANRKQ